MYLLLSDGKVLDHDLLEFKEIAGFLDGRIDTLKRTWPDYLDPSECWSSIDKTLSLGFIACQLYLTSSIMETGTPKNAALNIGPAHKCGLSYAKLIHEVANMCKHFEEWPPDLKTKGRHTHTMDVIKKLLGPEADSFLTLSILEQLVDSKDPKLTDMIPYLAAWRSSIEPHP